MNGESIVGVLIAAALVVALALAVANLSQNIHGTSHRVNDLSACKMRAESILSLFKNNDHNISLSNWHPYYKNGSMVLTPPPYSSGLTRGSNQLALISSDAANGDAPGTFPNQTNGWLLIDSAANWAAALYNQGGYCKTPVKGQSFFGVPIQGVPPFNGGVLTIPTGAISPTEKIYLDLERKNFSNGGSVDCQSQGELQMAPVSQTSVAIGGLNLGMQVTVTVSSVDNAGQTQSCQASTTVKPVGDSVAPWFLQVAQSAVDPDLGHCPGGGVGSECQCTTGDEICMAQNIPAGKKLMGSTGVGFTTVCTDGTSADVTLGLLSSEPASLFGCEIDMDPSVSPPLFKGAFNLCGQIQTHYGQFSTVETTYRTNTPTTGIQIQGKELPQGNYVFSSVISDSAQNLSLILQKCFSVVNGCPASWTNGFCAEGRGTPIPDQCQNAHACQATCGPSPGYNTCVYPVSVAPGSSYVCTPHGKPGSMNFINAFWQADYLITYYSDAACSSEVPPVDKNTLTATSTATSGEVPSVGYLNNSCIVMQLNQNSVVCLANPNASPAPYMIPRVGAEWGPTSDCVWRTNLPRCPP